MAARKRAGKGCKRVLRALRNDHAGVWIFALFGALILLIILGEISFGLQKIG